MRSFPFCLSVASFCLVLAGCAGDKSGDGRSARAQVDYASLDRGPVAAETLTLDRGLASWGQTLFAAKTCITCHTLGERKQGPDLIGVTGRRTARWLKQQITDPVGMVQNDSISKELYREFNLQMTDMRVKDAEADALIHYLLRESLAAQQPARAGSAD